MYHSSGVFSTISSTWSSRPPLAVKYRFEPSSIDEGGQKSLCSTLERLLAWEKKLYQEVKVPFSIPIVLSLQEVSTFLCFIPIVFIIVILVG